MMFSLSSEIYMYKVCAEKPDASWKKRTFLRTEEISRGPVVRGTRMKKKLNLTFWVNTVGFRIKCHTWDAKGLKNVDKKWSVKFKVVPTCRGLKLRRHADVSRADMSMFKVAMSDMSRRVSRRRHVEDQLKATSWRFKDDRHVKLKRTTCRLLKN